MSAEKLYSRVAGRAGFIGKISVPFGLFPVVVEMSHLRRGRDTALKGAPGARSPMAPYTNMPDDVILSMSFYVKGVDEKVPGKQRGLAQCWRSLCP